MASQFSHVKTYSRAISANHKGKGASWTASDVASEARRDEEHSKHVENPLAPVPLRGDLTTLEDQLDTYLKENKNTAKNGVERAARADAHVLMSNVYSWPQPVTTYDKKRFDAFAVDCLAFHEKEFKECQAAVIHLDEPFPHIHAYTFSSAAKDLHPGEVAKKAAYEAEPGNAKAKTKAGNIAYKAAMVDFQERFYQEVGKKHGLDRVGPKRQRLTQPEWQKQKRERLANLARLNEIEGEMEGLDQQSSEKAEELSILLEKSDQAKNEVVSLEAEIDVLSEKKDKHEELLKKSETKRHNAEKQLSETIDTLKKMEISIKSRAGAVNSIKSVFKRALRIESKEEKLLREEKKALRATFDKYKSDASRIISTLKAGISEHKKEEKRHASEKYELTKEVRLARMNLIDLGGDHAEEIALIKSSADELAKALKAEQAENKALREANSANHLVKPD